MILDREQDEAFLVLDEERFLVLFKFSVFLLLFAGFFGDMSLSNNCSGVFFSLRCAHEFLLEVRDGIISTLIDTHS